MAGIYAVARFLERRVEIMSWEPNIETHQERSGGGGGGGGGCSIKHMYVDHG